MTHRLLYIRQGKTLFGHCCLWYETSEAVKIHDQGIMIRDNKTGRPWSVPEQHTVRGDSGSCEALQE